LQLDVYLSQAEIQAGELKDRLVVVIDVLRASTTIITALANGARGIIPISEVEQAKKIASQFSEGSVLLGGERNELPILGFDLSNSPLEYTHEKVQGKKLIFTSSNGAQLFQYTRHASQTIVAGFVNVTPVCNYIAASNVDVAFLCAGKHRRIGLEDVICGGMIIEKLSRNMKNSLQLTESAVAAKLLYQHYAGNMIEMLYERPHGRRLIEIGQEKDLLECGAVDSIDLIPILQGAELIGLNRVP
jgi:2-phosphosulfolactate phosphatase